MLETLDAYFAGVNEDRFDDVAALFAPGATLTAPGVGPLERDEIAGYLEAALKGYPTHHDDPTRTVLAERTATVEITFTGERANGTPITFDALDVFDFDAQGQITRAAREGPAVQIGHSGCGRVSRYAALLACAALWGAVFVGVHELLPVLDPVQMVTLRFLAVAILFGVLLALHPPWRPKLTRREWGIAVLAGVLAVPVCQLAIVEGQRYLSPPIASLIVTFSPAIAAVVAALVGSERLSSRQAAGFALGLGGVAVIVVLGAGTGAELSASDPLKASVALLTPTAWALYTLISKPLAARHGSVGPVAIAMIVGSVTLIPLLPHAVEPVGELTAGHWLWLAYLVVGGTMLPYTFWAYGLRGLPVSRTTSFMYVIPCFALAWTALLLGDAPSGIAIAGGAVVLAGVALTQSAPHQAPGGRGDHAQGTKQLVG